MEQGREQPFHHAGSEQPANQIITFRAEDGRVVEHAIEELTEDAFSKPERKEAERKEAEGEELPPTDKIHPVLRAMIDHRPDDREQILINLLDDVTIPRFPDLVSEEPRESEPNTEVARQTEELITEITDRRAERYEQLSQEFAENYEAETLETFWLIRGMLVEMPLSAVHDIAEREDVLYVEPRYPGATPPQTANANPLDDVNDGRARIGTDPYFDLGLTGGFIGLLDTGVRFSHRIFNRPERTGYEGDCVLGDATCLRGSINPADDCWNHGTSSAAIISGNNNLRNRYRGVSGVELDSWKVYPSTFNPTTGACVGFLDSAAVVKAFQSAVLHGDHVIFASVQDVGTHLSTGSSAADGAFNAGAAIIATNGNFGPGAATVRSPANAHKAIGVGSVDVQTLVQEATQSLGPTPDGRIKPDIQAPTNSETASNAGDTAVRDQFNGTSGAGPYAAGAAALVRNFLLNLTRIDSSPTGNVDPGQVYACMILSGQIRNFTNTTGAGLLVLPNVAGRLAGIVGRVDVSTGQTVSIPFTNIGGGFSRLDGAIWWPDHIAIPQGPRDPHSRIDLDLVDPNGLQVDTSTHAFSVFQKVQRIGAIAPGTWSLRIRADTVFNLLSASLPVYYAAVAS
jgi:serine protease AprX